MKKKACIYGAGKNFQNWFHTIDRLYDIVCVVDSSSEIVGGVVCGHSIMSVKDVDFMNEEYDSIVVTPRDNKDILKELKCTGIEREKIVLLQDIFEDSIDNRELKLAIIFYGGMGDFLIGKNWLYYIIEKYSLEKERWDVYIDSVAYERGREIFENSSFINSVYGISCDFSTLKDKDEYDLILRFCIVPFVQSFNGDLLARRNKELLKYILRLQEFGFENYLHGFCHNPFYHKMIRRIMDNNPQKQYQNFCDIFDDLGIGEKYKITLSINKNPKSYLDEKGLLGRKFVTIDTGLNMDYKGGSSTRAWSHQNWNELAKLIKRRFPEIVTVQVGEKMSEEDDIDADYNLNGKTDIDEIRILMKYAAVHFDYDGGLVHVRHILKGGPSIVLFGPTAVCRHSYSENIAIRTKKCASDCEWTTESWLFSCPKGGDVPMCMASIEPELVCNEVEQLLGIT